MSNSSLPPLPDTTPAESTEPPLSPPPSLNLESIRQAFDGADAARAAEQVPSPGFLRSALAALVVSLVPALYFLILAGVAYTVFMLAVFTKPELVEGLPSLRKFFGWAAPIFAGILLLYYMIKPLLSRRASEREGTPITPEQQPLFYAFTDEIARATGTRVPAGIWVDAGSRVQAERKEESAGIELTVGLSLVASLNTAQFAAAIGAELARFAEAPGTGMALRVHRRICWLAAIVEHRDSFDETIEGLCESESRLMRSFGLFFRWVVRLVRGVLHALLSVAIMAGRGHTVPQQLRADAAAARLAGPAEFRSMLRLLPLLDGSLRLADRGLARCVREALPEDFPAFVSETLARLPARTRNEIQEEAALLAEAASRLRPISSQRADGSMKLGRQGLVQIEAAASELFTDYPSLSARVSMSHYLRVFGHESARRAWILPTARFVYEHEGRAFGTALRDEMIDYNTGDRWYKWRHRASTVGSLVMTIALLLHTANQLVEASVPAEEYYGRNIGLSVLVPEIGFREILAVRYCDKGEVIGHQPGWEEEIPVIASSTGWFYDTGEGDFLRCDEYTRDSKLVDPADLGLETDETPDDLDETLDSF